MHDHLFSLAGFDEVVIEELGRAVSVTDTGPILISYWDHLKRGVLFGEVIDVGASLSKCYEWKEKEEPLHRRLL
jgi:hypothetical protein